MVDPAKGMAIHMERADLEGIGQFDLPAPYSLRWYRPGDEKDWVAIHVDADDYNDITMELYTKEFGTDAEYTARRMCFLCDGEGGAMGTASAWHEANHRGAAAGRLHWVCIVKRLHGRGLAKPLLTSVLGRMKQLGYERACLSTDTRRLAAVSLYLKFGFIPEIRDEKHLRAWEWIRTQLPGSPLEAMDLRINEQP